MAFPSAVPLGGYVSGGGGTLPVLGGGAPEITANGNLTLSLTQADPFFLAITSDGLSTGTRKVVVPLIEGKTWLVVNQVSEGLPIEVVGASGTGVFILAGTSAFVTTDGVNCFEPGADAIYPTTVTFQPAGPVAGGSVFTAWANLIRYVTELVHGIGYAGPITYVLDGSFNANACLIPASAIPGASIEFVGKTITGGRVAATFANGITFSDLPTAGGSLSFTDVSVIDQNTGILATISGLSLTIDFVNSQWSPTAGSGAAFSCTNGGDIGITASDSNLGSGTTRALVTLDAGNFSSTTIFLSASTLLQYAAQGTDSGSITVSCSNGSSVSSHADAAAYNVVATAETAIGASLVSQTTFSDLASQVRYAPTTPGNWATPPAVVGVGLDDLAALLAPFLNGGTLTLSNGAASLTLQMKTATGMTAPAISVVGGAGEALAASPAGTGGNWNLTAGPGGASSTGIGGLGGTVTIRGGQGGSSTAAANGQGGNILIAAGVQGTGGFSDPSHDGQLAVDVSNITALLLTPTTNQLGKGSPSTETSQLLGGDEEVVLSASNGAAGGLVHSTIGEVFSWAETTGQGAPATQAASQLRTQGVATVPATSTVTIYQEALSVGAGRLTISGALLGILVCRATANGGGVSIGDTFTALYFLGFEYAGVTTVPTAGGVQTLAKSADASLNTEVTLSVHTVGSSANLTLQVGNASGASLDCTFTVLSRTLN